jgi:hypothetical protein
MLQVLMLCLQGQTGDFQEIKNLNSLTFLRFFIALRFSVSKHSFILLLFEYAKLFIALQNYPAKCITLYKKSFLCIPRNETAQPRSQFLHTCICERFIYSQDWSAYYATEK